MLCFLATVEGKRRTSGYEEFILEKNVTLAPWQYFNTNISQTTKLSLNLTTSGRGNRGEVHYSVWRKPTKWVLKQVSDNHLVFIDKFVRVGSFSILLLDNVNGAGLISPILEESETEIKTVSAVLTRATSSPVLNSRVVKYIKVLDSSKEIIFAMPFWNK